MQQSAVAMACGFVPDGSAEGLFLADEDDHPLASGDAGVEEIALE